METMPLLCLFDIEYCMNTVLSSRLFVWFVCLVCLFVWRGEASKEESDITYCPFEI